MIYSQVILSFEMMSCKFLAYKIFSSSRTREVYRILWQQQMRLLL